MPDDRSFKIQPVWEGGMKLWIDGELQHSQTHAGRFNPAIHRCSVQPPLVENAKAGWHRVTVQLIRPTRPQAPFAFIVSDENRHWMTDVKYDSAVPQTV